MESFESAGLWWIHDNEDDQVVGTLKYSDEDGFRLGIPFGHLGGDNQMVAWFNESESIQVAYGLLRNGRYVTLINPLRTNITLNMPGAGTEEYYASRGYIGKMKPEIDPQIEQVRIAFTHLRDWIANHPFTSSYSTNKDTKRHTAVYHYEQPEPETLAAGNGWTMLVSRSTTLPPANQTGFNVKHDCEIRLVFENPIRFSQMATNFLGPLWQFFVFCLNHAVDNPSLRFQPPGTGEWIDVGRHQLLSDSEDKIILPQFMLLSRAQLGEKIPEALSYWLAATEDERRAIALLTGLMADKGISSDLRFLVTAQALEALSRVETNELELKPEEFERRKAIAIDSIDDSKVKKWVKRKLEYANSKSFRVLLKDLLYNIGPYATKVAPDQESLLNDILDNRNFYTHRDHRDKPCILEGEKLHVLTESTILLLKAAVLRRLKFTEQQTLEIMEDCQEAIQWRLRTEKQYATSDDTLADQ